MRKLLLLISIIYSLSSYSQEKKVPSIVVLSPQEMVVDKTLDSIAKSYKHEGKLTNEQKENIRQSNGEEFAKKSEKEILFLEKMDLGSQLTFGLNFYFSYKLYEYHKNHIVYPAHEASDSSLNELKKIAEKHDVNWVVNFPKVEFLVQDESNIGVIRYQLYNLKFNEIVLDENLKVNDQNPGFEFACKSGTINCVINNFTNQINYKVLGFLNNNKKYWR